MPTILFVGGGSAGHIAPSLAVWEKFHKIHPEFSAHFVCDDRKSDVDFLEQANQQSTKLNAPRFSWSFPWKFFGAAKEARKIIESVKPSIIFSTGGYVSVPVSYIAKKKKIPIVLFEADAVSGRANRIVKDFAAEVCFGFPLRKTGDHSQYTGHPLREKVISGSKEEGKKITGFDGNKPVLLVMGGSQGAQTINEAITEHMNKLLKICDICHITGVGKKISENKTGYWSKEFVTDELPHLYKLANSAVSRAGAGSIAELVSNMVPTILVPLRGVAHDHQIMNAKRIKEAGACIILDQSELGTRLVLSVQSILGDANLRMSLQNGMQSLKKEDAALQIAQIISKTLDQQ